MLAKYQRGTGFPRVRRRRFLLKSNRVMVTLILILVAIAMPAQEKQTSKTILDGVYTAAQAERGRDAYMESCSGCHREDLRGGAEALPLIGPRFIDQWREDKLSSLFTHISTRMPRAPRPKLALNTYLDIVAFILQSNGYPAGNEELTSDAVKTTWFVSKNGPKPIPNLSTVLVVGCLESADNKVWTLTSATEPLRNRTPDATNEDELSESRSQTLGTGKIRVQNFEYVRPGFTADPFKGQKVQVKGTLIQATNNNRINVTSLESLAPACP
jgi:mono/diheme cytochrome c family protein